MKRFILMALFAVVAMGASAQAYLGGSFNLGTKSVKVGDGDATSTTTFALMPEVGYKFTPVLSIGAEVGFGVTKTEDTDAINLWSLAPYVRFNLAKLGSSVNFFTDAVFEYDWISQGSHDTDGYCFGIRPGLSVDLNSNWSILGKMVLFSYSKYDQVKTTTFAIQPNQVSLGIVYNF